MERMVNPAIPYLGHIVGNFTTGKTIVIEGMVTPPSQRIVINLQTGKNISHKDDVALQLSCRLLEGKIARNSIINGLPGTDEMSGLYPLTAGKRFKITIKNEMEKYVVTVNDNTFSYRHRLPSSRVNHISIQGDTKLYMIEYESNISQGDNFMPIYDEPPPPYSQYPTNSQPKTQSVEEPSVMDTVFPLAVGTGLGALGTALISSLAGRSSQNTESHGQNCSCSKCTKERNRARQGQQQQQSSGWGGWGAGLATVAAVGAVTGLVYSLTKSSNNEDSDED